MISTRSSAPWVRLPVATRLGSLQVALALAGFAFGLIVRAHGLSYEGTLLAYLLPMIAVGQRQFMSRFRIAMPLLALGLLLPALIAIQNSGVRAGSWRYAADAHFWLGYLRASGDGPWRWTRFLYTGVEMPAIEYLFYPAMAYFMMLAFNLFSLLAREHAESSTRLRCFFGCYAALSAGFLALLIYRNRLDAMDRNWFLTGVGLTTGWLGLLASPSLRRVVSMRWFWHWLLVMGCGFQPAWEFVHSCINKDWVYVERRSLPPLYTFNGAPIPIVEPFAYLAVSVTFPALMCLLADHLPRLVKKDGHRGFFRDDSRQALARAAFRNT